MATPTPVQQIAFGGDAIYTPETQVDGPDFNTVNPNEFDTSSTITPGVENVFGSGESQTASVTGSEYYVYKKEESATAPITQSKNLFGANLDVVGKLDKIVFEEYGDGSLRNSIAYIVPWSRGESPIKTQTPPSYAEAFGQGRDAFFADITSSLGANFGFNDSDLPIDISESFDATSSSPLLSPSTSTFPAWSTENNIWEGKTLNLSSLGTVIDQKGKAPSSGTTDIESRQKKLGSEIPVGIRQGAAFGAELLTGFVKKENTQIGKFLETGVSQVAGALDIPSGPIYVGNASGLVSQALDYATLFGFNIPGRGLTTSIKPDLQSNRSKWNGGVISEGGAAGVPQGAWQFLFNPNQLSLSLGPKYKETSTWGVGGDANGGNQLHWTGNKNPQLKFSKVLLNGYVFGRQVESLEQGLIELFMKNPSGNSSHGPQVLEFVWGQRTFGPCVIKDIQIEEKMWDNGLLVNADVSFTLEKIPEWTINDGQVSVYDSSAIEPITPPEESGDTGTRPSESPDSKDKPATGEPPAAPSKGPTKQQIAKKCTNLKNTISNLETIKSSPSSLFGLVSKENPAQAQDRLKKYKLMYEFADNQKISSINVGKYTPQNIDKSIDIKWESNSPGTKTQQTYPFKTANDILNTAISFLIGNLNTQINSKTCTNAIAQTSQNG